MNSKWLFFTTTISDKGLSMSNIQPGLRNYGFGEKSLTNKMKFSKFDDRWRFGPDINDMSQMKMALNDRLDNVNLIMWFWN